MSGHKEESQSWLQVCVDGGECAEVGGGAGGGAGGGGWGWRAAAGEGAGTALLVLLCCLRGEGAGAGAGADTPGGELLRALTAGTVVAALVAAFDHISGAQLNPAVSLAKLVSGALPWRHAVTQWAAQVAGAAFAARALRAAPRASTCLTAPSPGVSALQALGVEALATSVLALASLASWRGPAHAADTWPLRAGAVVAAMSLAAGNISGASMNPARSVGPAICAGEYSQLWVYVVGPLLGAAVTAALHRALMPPPAPARFAAPDAGRILTK